MAKAVKRKLGWKSVWRNVVTYGNDFPVMKHFPLILLAALTWSVNAQIELTQDLTPEALVEVVLEGDGMDAFNVTYSGSLDQLAVLTGGSSAGLPFDEAVVISTGHALAAGCGSEFLQDGNSQVNDPQLLEVANSVPALIGQSFGVNSLYDLASLEFDFIAGADLFGFAFFFASKEYPTYINTQYNDVFAFFISGPGIGAFDGDEVNMAVIPDTAPPLPITVSSVNNQTNPEWFAGALEESCIPGFTVLIPAVQEVVAGATYHIRLAIADGSDSALDSWVAIGEFNSGTLGCTDEGACNYDPEASLLDTSCTYPEPFYDCEGNCLQDADGDGVCDELEIAGCTDEAACNYNSEATDDDGSCDTPVILFDGSEWSEGSVVTVYCTMDGVLESVNWSFQPFGLVDIISIDGDSVQLVISSSDPVTITASVSMSDGSECETQITFPEPPSSLEDPFDPTLGQMVVYPNPASDRVVVRRASHPGPGHLVLTSVSGKKMLECTWPAVEVERELDVSNLPPGVYLLRAAWNGHAQHARVVIQR